MVFLCLKIEIEVCLSFVSHGFKTTSHQLIFGAQLSAAVLLAFILLTVHQVVDV